MTIFKFASGYDQLRHAGCSVTLLKAARAVRATQAMKVTMNSTCRCRLLARASGLMLSVALSLASSANAASEACATALTSIVLGAGHHGVAHLITGPDGPRVRKIYERPFQLTDDLDSFDFLERHLPVGTFAVTHARRFSNVELESDYVQGPTLRTLLDHQSLADRKMTEKLFETRLEEFANHLQNDGLLVSGNYWVLTVFNDKTHRDETLRLHEENIIVDPTTLAMTIIDPR